MLGTLDWIASNVGRMVEPVAPCSSAKSSENMFLAQLERSPQSLGSLSGVPRQGYIEAPV